MMKQYKSLIIAGALLGTIFSATTAGATAAASVWKWTGTTGSKILDLNSSFGQSMTFNMYSWADKTNAMELTGMNDLSAVINIVGDSASGYSASATTVHDDFSMSSNSIDLGNSPKFGFYFSNGTNNYYSYTLIPFAAGDKWTLLGDEAGMDAVLTAKNSGVTPSAAVPLPGTLLILGSGLMSLLGIGIRKNKESLS